MTAPTLLSLSRAADAELGPAIGARVASLFTVLRPGEGATSSLTFPEAAKLLAGALFEGSPAFLELADGLPLMAVTVTLSSGATVALPVAVAQDHALTRAWFAETAEQALAVVFACVWGGADLAPGVSEVPLWQEFELFRVRDGADFAYGARLVGHFPHSSSGALSVALEYGVDGGEAAFRDGRSISGAALVRLIERSLSGSPVHADAAAADAAAAAGDAAALADWAEDAAVQDTAADAAATAADASQNLKNYAARAALADALLRGCQLLPGPDEMQ